MVISVRLFVLYICLLLWVGVVHGEAIPETFRLVTVKFEGVHSIQKEKLAETLALKIHEKWKFWKPKPILNRSDLDEDLVRIKQYYQRNGYYHTNAVYKVDVSRPAGPGADSEKDESKDGALADLAVTYTVTEGPPVLIETIDIRVEKPVDGIDASRLEDSLPIQTGKIFVVDAYNTAKKELSKIYGNKGYALSETTGKVIVDPEDNTARITLQVDPGTQYLFGDIQIKDNDGYVKDIVIRRAMRFKPGERYNSKKIEQSQRNLHNLDAFKVAADITLHQDSEQLLAVNGVSDVSLSLMPFQFRPGTNMDASLTTRGTQSKSRLRGNGENKKSRNYHSDRRYGAGYSSVAGQRSPDGGNGHRLLYHVRQTV